MKSRVRCGRPLFAVVVAMQLATAIAAEQLTLLAGPERTAQARMGRDLARYVAPTAGMALKVVTTAGPGDSLQRLHEQPAMPGNGLKLAFLQADIAQAYMAAVQRGTADAGRWLASVHVLAPLHEEELLFIVRSDSALDSVQDIRESRINVGPLTGGTALSATTLYRLLFSAPIPEERLGRFAHEEALVKLVTDRTIDVVAVLAEPTAPLFANMRPEARRFVKVLKFDLARPGATSALRTFRATTLRAASYPHLLSQDLPGLATRIHLVVHGYRPGDDDAQLARWARAYCQALPRLKANGHPKWREVEPGRSKLAPGWKYAEPAAQELARCR